MVNSGRISSYWRGSANSVELLRLRAISILRNNHYLDMCSALNGRCIAKSLNSVGLYLCLHDEIFDFINKMIWPHEFQLHQNFVPQLNTARYHILASPGTGRILDDPIPTTILL